MEGIERAGRICVEAVQASIGLGKEEHREIDALFRETIGLHGDLALFGGSGGSKAEGTPGGGAGLYPGKEKDAMAL